MGRTPINVTGTLYSPPVDRYLLKINYQIKNWNIWSELIYHPRKFASEGIWASGDTIWYDPKPKWDLNLGIRFNF